MRGGARKGAGRKKGSLTKRTQQIAAQAAAEGIMPSEVLIRSMRKYWEEGEVDKAVAVADKAAPYFHPRLSAVDANVTGSMKHDIDDFDTRELLAIARGGGTMGASALKGKGEPH